MIKDNNLIHKPKTPGMSKNLLKINLVRKDSQGPLSFYLGFGESLRYLVLFSDRNIPLPASILTLIIEDADVLIFQKISYVTIIYRRRLQPSGNNDKTFQRFDATRLA